MQPTNRMTGGERLLAMALVGAFALGAFLFPPEPLRALLHSPLAIGLGAVALGGVALDTVSGFVTAPSSTFTAWTLGSGDSLTVRNAPLDSQVWLLSAWAFNNVAGTLRVRSPKLHDNVQGYRARIQAAKVYPLWPHGTPQRLYPQDTLIVEQTGSAVGGEIESGSLLIYYTNLPGQAGRFIDEPTLRARGVNYLTVENAITTGAAGGYSGSQAINTSFDLFKANTDYALIGCLVTAEACTIGWKGVDVGNLRVSCPATVDFPDMTREWFLYLTRRYSIPLIPVFNSANKAGILIDAVTDDEAVPVTVSSIFAELAPA